MLEGPSGDVGEVGGRFRGGDLETPITPRGITMKRVEKAGERASTLGAQPDDGRLAGLVAQ